MAGEVKEKKDMTKKQGSVKPMASEQVNTITPVVANRPEVKFDEDGKPVVAPVVTTTEMAARLVDAGTAGFPQGSVAGQVENAPAESIAPEVKPEDAPIEREPDERLGLAGQVTTAPTAPNLGVAPMVDENNLAKKNEIPDSPLVALYKQLNPEPKQRTPEEEAEYQRQRKATNIIMGISDAINGLSNLGATMAGAPSRNIDSLTGKWSEALNAAEQERQKKSAIWREGYLKAALEDYKNAQALAKEQRERGYKKEDDAAALANSKALKHYDAELNKSAREHDAKIKAEQAKTAHGYKMAEIKESGKQQKEEAEIRAAASAANAAGKADGQRPTFVATVNGNAVDVVLREESDYSTLYNLISDYIANKGSAAEQTELSTLAQTLSKLEGDEVKSASYKKNFVLQNFSKYYDKIKNSKEYKLISPVFKDGSGNVVEFRIKPRDTSETLVVKNPKQTEGQEQSTSQSFIQPAFGTPYTRTMPWRQQ